LSNSNSKNVNQQSKQDKVKVLFVCMGNICRSPTAEGVFLKLVEQHSLQHCIAIDSAGTHAYHAGEGPDKRAHDAAAKRGYDLSKIKARIVVQEDFSDFDYVMAMDVENLENLQEMASADSKAEVKLFLDYAVNTKVKEVPDPYYGGAKGFEKVLDLVEAASTGLLKHIVKTKLVTKK